MQKGKQSLQSSSSNNSIAGLSVKSSRFRVGARMFFFDVNTASNSKNYLRITESRFTGEGKDRIRNSVVLFGEDLVDFQKSLKEMAGYLS